MAMARFHLLSVSALLLLAAELFASAAGAVAEESIFFTEDEAELESELSKMWANPDLSHTKHEAWNGAFDAFVASKDEVVAEPAVAKKKLAEAAAATEEVAEVFVASAKEEAVAEAAAAKDELAEAATVKDDVAEDVANTEDVAATEFGTEVEEKSEKVSFRDQNANLKTRVSLAVKQRKEEEDFLKKLLDEAAEVKALIGKQKQERIELNDHADDLRAQAEQARLKSKTLMRHWDERTQNMEELVRKQKSQEPLLQDLQHDLLIKQSLEEAFGRELAAAKAQAEEAKKTKEAEAKASSSLLRQAAASKK